MTSDPNNNENYYLSSQSSEITQKSDSSSETTVSDIKTIHNQSSPLFGMGRTIIITVIGLATLATILIFGGNFEACIFSSCPDISDGGIDQGSSGLQNLLAVIFAIGSYILGITLGLTIIPAFLVSLLIWFITQIVL
ncbi:MAG: hypothetical protein RI580_05920 [Halothece sp. Uz-M2-17]|nr:hypothetical protein [Halothece sp. Uz-M2-17]